jgi:hypothetical protein
MHLQDIAKTDIFFMTGFSPGSFGIPPQLRLVFSNHARMGEGQGDMSSMMENLYRSIVARVQYNQMVYMGTCGGAMVADIWFWNIRNQQFDDHMKLFDFCMGVSLRYDPCMSCYRCDASKVIGHNTFYITSGAAVAVHIENDVAAASLFPCGKITRGRTGLTTQGHC